MKLKECTTLCYLENEDSFLMLHRVKKENDESKHKYIGVGGHIEEGESPEECIIREVKEETGLTLNSFKLRGLLTFVINGKDELAWVYTSDDFCGEIIECDEGELEWIKKDALDTIPLWEGDTIFLKLLMQDETYFSLKLVYENNKLIESKRLI